MTILGEAEFINATTQYLVRSQGPEYQPPEPDQNLATEVGLDSLRLISLLRFIEQLRGDELGDIPEIGELTLRTCYRLYLGGCQEGGRP